MKRVRLHSEKWMQRKAAAGKQARRASWLNHQLKQGRNKCEYCKGRVTRDPCHPDIFATVDHIIPLSKGGFDGPNNWAVCCNKCNQAKADKLPEEAFA